MKVNVLFNCILILIFVIKLINIYLKINCNVKIFLQNSQLSYWNILLKKSAKNLYNENLYTQKFWKQLNKIKLIILLKSS